MPLIRYKTPPSSQIKHKTPPSSQIEPQAPSSPQTGSQAPPSSQTGSQAPPSSQTGHKAPPSSQIKEGLDYILGTQPLNVFTTSDPFEFNIFLKTPATALSHVAYTIKDFWDATVYTGKVDFAPGALSASFCINNVKTGHYFVEVNTVLDTVKTDAAVVVRYEERPQYANTNFDSPFGYDTSFAWFNAPKPGAPVNQNGRWHVYKFLPSDGAKTLVDTGIASADVPAPHLRADNHWWILDTGSGEYVDTGIFYQGLPSGSEYHGDSGILGQYARATKLSGVTWIRKRIGGMSSPSAYDNWIRLTDYQNLWKLCSFIDPADQRATENIFIGQKLPDDLLEYKTIMYNYGAYRINDRVMLQLYNENEAYETWMMEGSDKIAAVTKAMMIGLSDAGNYGTFGGLVARTNSHLNLAMLGDSTFLAANPNFAGTVTSLKNYAKFQDCMFENEIMQYVDAYTFHNHRDNISPDAETANSLLWFDQVNDPNHQFSINKNLGHINKWKELGEVCPIWCSEAGGACANTLYQDGLDPAHQRIQARYLVTATIRSISSGVDKHFWFFGRPTIPSEPSQPPYKNVFWGSFGPWIPKQKQLLPYAAYSAQSTMTFLLGEGVYIGKLSGLASDVQGYVFKKNATESVIVIWANAQQNVSLPLTQMNGMLYDLMGNGTSVAASGGSFTFQVNENPVYLTITGDILNTLYVPSTHTRRTWPRPPKVFSPAQRIVLDQIHDIRFRQAWTKYKGIPVPIGVNSEVTVAVFNFNSVAIDGKILGEFDNPDYSFMGGASRTINVPANSKGTVTFTITSTGTRTQPSAKLKFIGSFAGVGQSTPTVTIVQKALPIPDMTGEKNKALNVDNFTQHLTTGVWRNADGFLTHDNLASSGAAWIKLNSPTPVPNGVVTMKFRLRNAPNWDFVWGGIILRRTDQSGNLNVDGYRIILMHDGNCVAYCGQSGASKLTASNRSGPMSLWANPNIGGLLTGIMSPMNYERELQVAFQGNLFEVYVDGVWQFCFEDNTHVTGAVGAFFSNCCMDISDFRVKVLP